MALAAIVLVVIISSITPDTPSSNFIGRQIGVEHPRVKNSGTCSTTPCVVDTLVLSNNTLVSGNYLPSPSGITPDRVVYDSGKSEIFVSIPSSNVVDVISVITDKVVATVPVGNAPGELSYDNGTGEIFVANSATDNVSVISDLTNAVVATVSVGHGPSGVTYDSSNGNIFVANSASDNVSVISGTTNVVIATIPVGVLPGGMVYDVGKGEIFVSLYNDSTGCTNLGMLSVISGSSDSVIANVSLGAVGPGELAYDPTHHEVYVAYYGCGSALGNEVSAVDDNTNRPVANITVGSQVQSLAIVSAQGEVYDANQLSNDVSIISDSNMNVVGSVAVGSNPVGLAYNPNSSIVYVANHNQGTISLISTQSGGGGPTLTSVILRPSSIQLVAGGSQTFTATPVCTPSPCPSTGTSFSWTLTNYLGTLDATSGPVTTYTAGSSAGSSNLTVVASLNGGNPQFSTAQITIVKNLTSPGNSGATSGGAFPWINILVVVAVVVAVVAAVVVTLLLHRKWRGAGQPPNPYPPQPQTGQQPSPVGNSQQGLQQPSSSFTFPPLEPPIEPPPPPSV